jgi:hypothetical protein
LGSLSPHTGELAPHEGQQEAIRQIVALQAEGMSLRAIAETVTAGGVKISHEGVQNVLRAHGQRLTPPFVGLRDLKGAVDAP